MPNVTKFFIGNWKMFGIPSSFKIIDKINDFVRLDKKHNQKYKVIIAPPFTLLQDYSKRYKYKKIILSAQNCYHKNSFGAFTGNISPYMVKKIGINYIIIGHSESRADGDNDKIIQEKIFLAIKNNLNIIYCIGENKKEKKDKKTLNVLKKQILSSIKKNYNLKKIIFAYEPVWSIGSGKVPSINDLNKTINFMKKFVKRKYDIKNEPKFLYGGSVDKKIISNFKSINKLDGFLIGGASKSSKKFIDIIKYFYK